MASAGVEPAPAPAGEGGMGWGRLGVGWGVGWGGGWRGGAAGGTPLSRRVLLPGAGTEQHWRSQPLPALPDACCDLQHSPSPQQGQARVRSVMAAEGRGEPLDRWISPNLPVLNPLPFPHYPTDVLRWDQPRHHPAQTTIPSTICQHRPPSLLQGTRGPQGTRSPQGRGGWALGAAAAGPYLSQGGQGTGLQRGAAGAGAPPASPRQPRAEQLWLWRRQ